jgi:hypothetical protein
MSRVASILLLGVVIAPWCVQAQLDAKLSLPKTTYRAGDRKDAIIVSIQLTNVGKKPIRIIPLEACAGLTVGIEVTPIEPWRKRKPYGIAGDCIGSARTVVLAAGETRTESFNATQRDFTNELDVPGRYRLRVTRIIQYSSAEGAPEFLLRYPQKQFTHDFIVTMERVRGC